MRPKKAPSHQTPSGLIAMCWMGWGASLQSTFACFIYLPTAPWELSLMHRWGKYGSVKFPHFTRVALIFGTASGAHAPFLPTVWLLLHPWLWKEEVQKGDTVLRTLWDNNRMSVWEMQKRRWGNLWLLGILLWANDQAPSRLLCHIHLCPNPHTPWTQPWSWKHLQSDLGIIPSLVWRSDVGFKVWIWTSWTLLDHLDPVLLLPVVPQVIPRCLKGHI